MKCSIYLNRRVFVMSFMLSLLSYMEKKQQQHKKKTKKHCLVRKLAKQCFCLSMSDYIKISLMTSYRYFKKYEPIYETEYNLCRDLDHFLDYKVLSKIFFKMHQLFKHLKNL